MAQGIHQFSPVLPRLSLRVCVCALFSFPVLSSCSFYFHIFKNSLLYSRFCTASDSSSWLSSFFSLFSISRSNQAVQSLESLGCLKASRPLPLPLPKIQFSTCPCLLSSPPSFTLQLPSQNPPFLSIPFFHQLLLFFISIPQSFCQNSRSKLHFSLATNLDRFYYDSKMTKFQISGGNFRSYFWRTTDWIGCGCSGNYTGLQNDGMLRNFFTFSKRKFNLIF